MTTYELSFHFNANTLIPFYVNALAMQFAIALLNAQTALCAYLVDLRGASGTQITTCYRMFVNYLLHM